MKRLILVLPIFLIFILFSNPAVAKKKDAILQGYDYIVAPGMQLTLEVKVERAKFFPTRVDLKKQRVHFYKEGFHLGTSISGRDGVAKLETVFYKAGIHRIKVELDQKSKYRANITDNRVLVVEPSVPLLVSDIDHTLADISGRDFLRTRDRYIPTLPQAPQVLKRITKEFKVFYMTARDDSFIKRTKNWLDIKKFPLGPSFFWDFGFFNGVPSNHGEFKSGVLKRLTKKFKNILVGVGDKPHDVAAYRENGLRAYYIGKPGELLASGVISVKSWIEVEKHLKANPLGSLAGDPDLK